MIIRGDKVFRSLEEQVFKNQWDIESLQKQTGMLGIKPVAQVVTVEQLPLVSSEAYKALAYGDAYAVGDDSVADPSFKYYVKAKLLGVDGWLALGYIKGEQGPEGKEGKPGEKGPAGTIAAANATVDFGTGVPEVDLVLGGTPSNRTFTFNFHNLKGQKGDRGPAGSVSVVAPDWEPTESYTKDSWVVYDNVLYKAIQNVPIDTPLTPDYWEAIPDGLSSILKAVIEDYGEGTFTARDNVARQDIATTNIRLLDAEDEIASQRTEINTIESNVSEIGRKVDTLEAGYNALSEDMLDVKDDIRDIYERLPDEPVEPQNNLGEYNCATGYPATLELPYTAQKGDYFTAEYTEAGQLFPSQQTIDYDMIPVQAPETLVDGSIILFGNDGWEVYHEEPTENSYNDLTDKPMINGVELVGDKTAEELGISGGFDGNPLHWPGKEITSFNHGCALGDSITEGLLMGRDPIWNTPNEEYGKTNMYGIYSYPATFEKLTNVPLYNAGISGTTSGTLLGALSDAASFYGAWGEHGWRWQGSGTGANALDGSVYDFYILAIGINDIWQGVTPSTINTNINSLINWTRGNQTYTEYYKPVFLCTIPPFWYKGADAATKALIDEVNNYIRGYESALNHVFVIDLARYSETADKPEYFFDHLTALGYNKLGTEIANGVSYAIANNTAAMKFIQHFYFNNLEDIPETYLSMVEHEYSFVDENFQRKV